MGFHKCLLYMEIYLNKLLQRQNVSLHQLFYMPERSTDKGRRTLVSGMKACMETSKVYIFKKVHFSPTLFGSVDSVSLGTKGTGF